MKHETNKKSILIYLFFSTFILLVIFIPFYHLPVIADEVNPTALIAIMKGYDWQQYMIADGYYYKYGQLLLYGAVLFLCDNVIIAYRLMLFENAIITSLVPVFMYLSLEQIMKDCNLFVDNRVAILVTQLCALLPSTTLGCYFIWSEPFQLTSFWMLIYLSIKILSPDVRHKNLLSVLIGIMAGYSFMVHSRGILTAGASVCVMAVILLYNRKLKLFLQYIITLFLMLCIDYVLSNIVKTIVYGQTAELSGSGISFIFDFFQLIAEPKGLQLFVREIFGWLFSCNSFTAGLATVGLIYAVTSLLKTTVPASIKICFVWGIVLLAGSILLGTAFFLDDLYLYENCSIPFRGDKLIYPRYMALPANILSFLGLFVLIVKRDYSKRMKYTLIFVTSALNTLFGVFVYRYIDDTITWSHNLSTVSFLPRLYMSKRAGLFAKIEQLSAGILLFAMLVMLIQCIVLANNNIRKTGITMGLFFLSVFIINSFNSNIRSDRYIYNIYSAYTSVIASAPDALVYLDDEIIRSPLQYMFPDHKIVTTRNGDLSFINSAIILSPKGTYNKDLFEDDYYIIDDIKDATDYNLYVKGESLASSLKFAGYKLQKYVPNN